jgi:predicted  nucleic acid-binding Zn-ribbon protein
MRRTIRTLLARTLPALAAALFVALPAVAQGPPQQAPPQQMQQEIPPAVQALIDELDSTQVRLEAIQQEAIEGSEELQAEVTQIQQLVEATVLVIEPEYEQLAERFGELQQEAMAAQQAEDQAQIQRLMDEAQGIQMRLQSAQEQAFEREDVTQATEAYREKLVAEMTRIDSDTPDLMQRMDELVAALTDIMG